MTTSLAQPESVDLTFHIGTAEKFYFSGVYSSGKLTMSLSNRASAAALAIGAC